MVRTSISADMSNETVNPRKQTGVHFTPRSLADFVASKILEKWEAPSQGSIDILDPAVGDGELLDALISKIPRDSCSEINAWGFDISCKSVELSQKRLNSMSEGVKARIICQDFLSIAKTQTFVFEGLPSAPPKLFDLAIANPPYVRTQVMGADLAQRLATEFELSGRIDLYHAFIGAIAKSLKPDGIAGIIVSNRFMTTQSGAAIRRSIRNNFDLLHVWDLGDTKLFDAAVLPAVLLLKRKEKPLEKDFGAFTSIYSSRDSQPATMAPDVFSALSTEGIVTIPNGGTFHVQHGRLDAGSAAGEIWRISTHKSDSWLKRVEINTFKTFRDIGKIRVGVKTTADKIFIRKNWQKECAGAVPELLRPLTSHRIARRFKAKNAEQQILYPHQFIDGKRKTFDLSLFPNTAAYLEAHRARLESREYVLKSGRKWFEIWVPQDPRSWKQPKLVFRDISEEPVFWLDLEETIVNGDCYWIVDDKGDQDDLLWLALAIGNSKFIENFYDYKFNNKLYAGRRRFMTQYVEKFPLPNPELPVSKEIIRLTRLIYDSAPDIETNHEMRLNFLIDQAFGIG